MTRCSKISRKPSDETSGIVAVACLEIAERETLDDERRRRRHHDARDERDEPGPAAREAQHALLAQAPRDHAGQHEQGGNGEIEKVQHANGQRERHGDGQVNRAEHEPRHNLLRDDATAERDGERHQRGDDNHDDRLRRYGPCRRPDRRCVGHAFDFPWRARVPRKPTRAARQIAFSQGACQPTLAGEALIGNAAISCDIKPSQHGVSRFEPTCEAPESPSCCPDNSIVAPRRGLSSGILSPCERMW